MTVFRLIREFSTRETVPIEVEEFVDFIKQLGVSDEIYFWEADINPDVLKATITHWEYPDGSGGAMRVVDIHTAKSLSPAEKRLAQAKELLHILDPVHYCVNTIEDVEALIDKIVLPPELVDIENEGVHANSDRAAIFHVLAAMFPWATRELLVGPFKEEKITLQQIADLVALPHAYVAFVLSDQWPHLHNAMVGRYPDKVHALKADHSPIEVHSVPLGDDPYSYARQLHLQNPDSPIAAFKIEWPNGETRTLTAAEIYAYSPGRRESV